MARYQLATALATNIWYDSVTGESFTEGDNAAWNRMQEWIAAGNTPDNTPATPAAPPFRPQDTRPGKIAAIAAQAKTALANTTISTPGEKALAAVLSQVLDGLAGLDPVPSAPPVITVPKAPVVVPGKPPTDMLNAGTKPASTK
jgi:hypothetical protein